MSRIGWTLAIVILVGISHQACSSKSGRHVGPGQTSNFEVTNRDNETIHVYVSGAEIGTTQPGQTARFFVNPGFRSVHFRERGDNVREHQGDFNFDTTVLRLTFDPAATLNLQVTNNSANTVHVIVDNVELDQVAPGDTDLIKVTPGRRDLFFRETGRNAKYFGTFNFNTSAVVDVDYP